MFTLFTSIPPNLSASAIEHHRICVASWRNTGFYPISFNGVAEIPLVQSYGLGIEFESAPKGGKPVIGDILQAIRCRGASHAGIINADCEIVAYPDLALRLSRVLRGRLLFAERIDRHADGALSVGECQGFDGFFADTTVLSNLTNRQFRMGETWWDYWLPLAVAANGYEIGCADVPLLLHQKHPAAWHVEKWIEYGRVFWLQFKNQEVSGRPLFARLGLKYDGTPSAPELLQIGKACFEWLRAQRFSTPLEFLPEQSGSLAPLLRCVHPLLTELANTKQALVHARSELNFVRENKVRKMAARMRWLQKVIGARLRQSVS
jgi:hypothetical protein